MSPCRLRGVLVDNETIRSVKGGIVRAGLV